MKYKINIEVDGGPDDRPLNEIRVQFVKDKSVIKTESITIVPESNKSPKSVPNKVIKNDAEIPAEMNTVF